MNVRTVLPALLLLSVASLCDAAGPSVFLTLNKGTYSPGDRMVVTLNTAPGSLNNDWSTFVALLLPDASYYFLSGYPTISYGRDTSALLDPPVASGTYTLLDFILPEGLPPGSWSWAAAAAKLDFSSVSSISWAPFELLSAQVFPNSKDADGFLWGTEGNVNTADADNLPATAVAARNAINNTLKSDFVKFRISAAFFSSTDGGQTYSTSYCLPKAGQCSVSFDMDEVAALFQANGWSMVPMLRIDESQNITTALIDNYVNFVDWFVSRYKTTASIRMIELVNSPHPGTDNWSTWRGTNAQLVELNNETYDRIKGKYPDIAVGTPGFEYWVDSTFSTDQAFIDVIEYFLDKNNGARFDFWAFHGYAMHARGGQALTGPYPPTMTPLLNKYANVPGILNIRAAMDANGWQAREIIDTEHDIVTAPGQPINTESDALAAAYLVQELVLKRTLQIGGVLVLSGALPLKMAIRGTVGSPSCAGGATCGEAGLSSLSADGSVTQHVKAMALLWCKLKEYSYAGHVSGAFDDENQVWVEKFTSGSKELYIFFKPFRYINGRKISLDGQTLNYTLNLGRAPSSAIMTDINGAATSVTTAQSLTLKAENAPKFLEINYP